ncbi:SpeK [Streptococcus pneumoniae]|nr:SpeK [Streptococcus pneumoniae]
MAHLKSFITRYSKVYIGLVLLNWLSFFLSFFFIPWDRAILGVRIDIFIIQKILLAFGILSILMALLSKKVSLFVFGLICCLSLWINLFILFALLPIFGN